MASINTIALSGNLAADPELRKLPNAMAVLDLRIGFTTSRQLGDGDWTDQSNFITVTVFGGRAENAAKKLHKGSFVMVQGRVVEDRWTAQDGTQRSRIKVLAQSIEGPDFFVKSDEPATQQQPEPVAA